MPRRRNILPDNVRLRRLDDGEQEVLEDGKPIGRVFRTPHFNQDGTVSRSDHWSWRDDETGDTDGGGDTGRQAARLLLHHRELKREFAERDRKRAERRADARADRVERGIRGGRVNGRMR